MSSENHDNNDTQAQLRFAQERIRLRLELLWVMSARQHEHHEPDQQPQAGELGDDCRNGRDRVPISRPAPPTAKTRALPRRREARQIARLGSRRTRRIPGER